MKHILLILAWHTFINEKKKETTYLSYYFQINVQKIYTFIKKEEV